MSTAQLAEIIPFLYSITYKYSKIYNDDMVQEALIKLYPVATDSRNLIYTIAKNSMINMLKSKRYINMYTYITAMLADLEDDYE